MADYNIDINVNMGGSQGNFQTLIDSVNNLNASFQKVGTAASTAASTSKQSFADSMGVMAQYGNSVKKVQSEISNLKKQIIEQNDALRKKKITDAEHKANIDKLYASMRQLQTAQRQYNNLLGQTTAQTSAASKSVNMLTTSFNKLGAVLGVSFGLYGVFRVLSSSIKTIAEFDLAQKKLQSVLGETSEGMKELSKSAIDLGKNSIFGAKGISELQIELAKMGFTKNEIIAMQGAINDLAIATQEDLAGSAEVVANIIKTFELTATQTRDVVNVMGKAFNDSALGLSNFRESIKYVAPVANQAGLSFRETVAALELLSNAGLKGSLAGTGLINVLKAMMDSNSKLAKSLGGTVSGWEGFTSVLQRAREEGWNMQDVFGLITQRATGAFSTFMEGLPTLEEMTDKLQEVSNVMRDQMLVQLDSISYQAKVTRESWNALVLDIDNGEGVISKSIKSLLSGLQKWLVLLGGSRGDLTRQLVDETILLKNALSLEGLDEITKDELEKYATLVQNKASDVSKMSANEVGNNLSIINDLISRSDELLSTAIVKGAEARIKALQVEGKTYEEFEGKRNAAILSIGFEMDALEKAGKRNTIQFKVLAEALEQIEKMNFKRVSEGAATDDDAEKARLKAIELRFKNEMELLKKEKDYRDEIIELFKQGYFEEIALEENSYKLKVDLANKELELAKALNKDIEQAKEVHKLSLQQIETEHLNNVVKIEEAKTKRLLEEQEKYLKGTKVLRDKYSKDFAENWTDKMQDLDDFMQKFRFKNPILGALFGQKIDEGLFSGLISEEDVQQFTEAIDTAFSSMSDSLNSYVDSWVESTDRIVEQLNRQIDETQSALETEVELMQAGYASNVTLKRNELEELKKEREKALADQREAQQAQVAIDTVTQLSSLITASAQIFKGMTAILPVAGIPIAIALIAAMFGAFTASKAKAMQTAGVSKFAAGGWIGGRSHREGGTMIEAEKDEFVVRKSSAKKYNLLIEAINKDNPIEINRAYMNNMKSQIVHSRVSLDDSKDLKAIRGILEKQGKSIEYSGGYRIERVGNVTTKIRLN